MPYPTVTNKVSLRKNRRKPVRSSAVLECGHPGRPSNLIGGQCGTCQIASEWERMAKESDTLTLKFLASEIAKHFRSGNIIYDSNGKTLLEIEAAHRPHSND